MIRNRHLLLTLATGLALLSVSACTSSETDDNAAAEISGSDAAESPGSDMFESRDRGAFDNSPFVFFGPAGTYDSVAVDGTSYSTTLNPDFSYVSVTADGKRETGRWTVDGALTCMSPGDGNVHASVSGHGEGRMSRCFVITDDASVKSCPRPRTDFPPQPINCVVAARPDADGTRTLTHADGSQSTTRKRARIADVPGDPAHRSPLLFESPVGSWETTMPDGSKYVTVHKEDFTSYSEAGDFIGQWTVQGGLTCMFREADKTRMTCFVISEDASVPCPELAGAPDVETVACVVASPLRDDGTRTLTTADGTVRVTRRVN